MIDSCHSRSWPSSRGSPSPSVRARRGSARGDPEPTRQGHGTPLACASEDGDTR